MANKKKRLARRPGAAALNGRPVMDAGHKLRPVMGETVPPDNTFSLNVYAPPKTPPELLERAGALVAAGERLGLTEEEVRVSAPYREVQLRIAWHSIFTMTEATAKVIVAATSPVPA